MARRPPVHRGSPIFVGGPRARTMTSGRPVASAGVARRPTSDEVAGAEAGALTSPRAAPPATADPATANPATASAAVRTPESPPAGLSGEEEKSSLSSSQDSMVILARTLESAPAVAALAPAYAEVKSPPHGGVHEAGEDQWPSTCNLCGSHLYAVYVGKSCHHSELACRSCHQYIKWIAKTFVITEEMKRVHQIVYHDVLRRPKSQR